MRYLKIRFEVLQDLILIFINFDFYGKLSTFTNIQISRSQILSYGYSLDNFYCLYTFLWPINFMLTHLEFMTQKFSYTLQVSIFKFNVYMLLLTGKMRSIWFMGHIGEISFYKGEYLYTFLKVFVSPYKLHLFGSLEWWGS